MPDFKKKNRFGGARKSFGSRPSFGGGRDFSDRKEMFDTECANCHKMTQVPFKPNGMKPVYCRDCFTPANDRAPREGFRNERPAFGKKEFGPRREHAPAARPDARIDELKREVATLHTKLDSLIASIESLSREKALTKAVQTAVSSKPQKIVKKPVKKAKKK